MSGPDVVECPCGWKLPTNVKRMIHPKFLKLARSGQLAPARIMLSCPICGQTYCHQPPVVGLEDDERN